LILALNLLFFGARLMSFATANDRSEPKLTERLALKISEI